MSDFKEAMLKLVDELEADGLQAKDFAALELLVAITDALARHTGH